MKELREKEPLHRVGAGLVLAVASVLLLTRHREPRHGYFGEEDEARRETGGEAHAPVGPEERSARAAGEREESEQGSGPAVPDDEPVGQPAPERAQGMTVVVRVAMRLVLPLLAMAGLYLFLLGYAPGGGFPAGVVLLGVVLLVYASVGYRRIAAVVRPAVLEVIELLGALAVIVVLGLGLALKGSFGANWLPLAPERTIRSGGILQAFSTAEVIEVGTGLIMIVFSIMAMLRDWIPGENTKEDDR